MSQMVAIESGRSTAAKIVDGVCYGILAADIAIPLAVKAGLFSISPLAGTILSLANLGCVAWSIASYAS